MADIAPGDVPDSLLAAAARSTSTPANSPSNTTCISAAWSPLSSPWHGNRLPSGLRLTTPPVP